MDEKPCGYVSRGFSPVKQFSFPDMNPVVTPDPVIGSLKGVAPMGGNLFC